MNQSVGKEALSSAIRALRAARRLSGDEAPGDRSLASPVVARRALGAALPAPAAVAGIFQYAHAMTVAQVGLGRAAAFARDALGPCHTACATLTAVLIVLFEVDAAIVTRLLSGRAAAPAVGALLAEATCHCAVAAVPRISLWVDTPPVAQRFVSRARASAPNA